MKTSPKGLKFIRDNEGCVLHIYKDQAGYPTIDVGHLITDSDPDFSNGITQEQAMEILAQDVGRFEDAVNGHGLDLTQNQFEVLVDFAFNAGEGALQQLLAHGLDQVPNQLPRWTTSRDRSARPWYGAGRPRWRCGTHRILAGSFEQRPFRGQLHDRAGPDLGCSHGPAGFILRHLPCFHSEKGN